MEGIVEEMKRCSGTQFDPDIVEIFIQFSEVGIRDIPEGFHSSGSLT